MTATIVKNSIYISVIEDYTFKKRRDGGLHTAEIHFYYTNSDLLNRWDRVIFNGVSWRVAEQPAVKINYETTADWLYTVTLIEPIAILKGVQMPNITFTQNLAKTKTIIDAIETALLKQSVRLYSSEPKYTLATTTGLTSADESILAPNDKFQDKTLYDILAYYGELVDARPILDESTNEISYIYFNDDNGTVLSPTFTSIEKSKSIEGYATDLIEDAENVHIDSPYNSHYPHRLAKTFYLPADLAQDMSYDNIKLELPFKIKKIVEIIMEIGVGGAIVLVSEPNALITDKFIYEKKEWETLNKDSFWSFTQFADWGQKRENCIYYEYGGNTIENLHALDYHATQSGYSGYGAHEIKVRVVYEALPDIQLAQSSEESLDGNIIYTEKIQQQASTIDLIAENTKIKNDLRNRQSIFYNVCWVSDTLPDEKSKVSVLGSDCLITNMVAQKVGGTYEVNARLASEYNKKNILTQAINENRIFEIPKTQTIIRKVIQNLTAKIELIIDELPSSVLGIWTNYNHNILFNFPGGNGVLTQVYEREPLMVFAEFEYLESETYIAVALPFTSAFVDDTLVVVARMTSNTSADWQRYIDSTIPVNYTASSAIVTDKNGENRTVKLKYIVVEDEDIITDNDGSDISFIETFPFVSKEFYDNGTMVSPINKKYDFQLYNRIALFKDSREQLQFENRIKIIAEENTTVNAKNIFKYSMFNNEVTTPQIKLVINNTVHFITVTSDITFDEDYIKIAYAYPASGTLQGVALHNGGEVLLSKVVNKTVASGGNGFVTIKITEE